MYNEKGNFLFVLPTDLTQVSELSAEGRIACFFLPYVKYEIGIRANMKNKLLLFNPSYSRTFLYLSRCPVIIIAEIISVNNTYFPV